MACVKLKKSHTGIKNQSEMLDLGSHNSLLQHDMCPHFVLQKSLPPSIHPSLGSTLTRHPIRIDTGSGGEGCITASKRVGGGGIFGSMRSEGRLRGGRRQSIGRFDFSYTESSCRLNLMVNLGNFGTISVSLLRYTLNNFNIF